MQFMPKMPLPGSVGPPTAPSAPLPPIPDLSRRRDVLLLTDDLKQLLGISDTPANAPANALHAPPVKLIHSQDSDLPAWLESEAFARILSFIQRLNHSVTNKTMSEMNKTTAAATPSVISTISNILDTLDGWINDIPPLDASQQRFGNRAFKIWIDRLESVKVF